MKGKRRILYVAGVLALLPLLAGGASASRGKITGTVSHPKGNADLVVYVDEATGKFSTPAQHAKMDQRSLKFVPFVLPVLAGTTVDFVNSDPIFHNVWSPDGERYNLGTWVGAEPRSYTFRNPGVYRQLCALHPEMLAYVIVRPNPYFAVTDEAGRFTISGVPDGRYELKVFGHRVGKQDRERAFPVQVSGGKGTASLTFGR